MSPDVEGCGIRDDAMSLDMKSIHLRLDAEVKSRVDVLADAAGKDAAELCREMVTERVMGVWHAQKILFERARRAGLVGSESVK
ncbi:hypothetical protein BH20PSE1_BH20PSE1_01350 [soil metagenome]